MQGGKTENSSNRKNTSSYKSSYKVNANIINYC